MNTTYILSKGASAGLWIVKQITGKFTAPYKKLKQWFPILEENKTLRYSIIPVVIALFAGLRWVLKQVMGLLVDSISTFASKFSEVDIPEKTIMMIVVGIVISTKIITQIAKGKKQQAK